MEQNNEATGRSRIAEPTARRRTRQSAIHDRRHARPDSPPAGEREPCNKHRTSCLHPSNRPSGARVPAPPTGGPPCGKPGPLPHRTREDHRSLPRDSLTECPGMANRQVTRLRGRRADPTEPPARVDRVYSSGGTVGVRTAGPVGEAGSRTAWLRMCVTHERATTAAISRRAAIHVTETRPIRGGSSQIGS